MSFLKTDQIYLIPFCLLGLVLLQVGQTFGQQDEVIVIHGFPLPQCGGPGTNLIDGQDGTQKCVCDIGWVQVDEHSDGEPMCRPSISSTPTPPVPVNPDPPQSPNPSPNPPTELQCFLENLMCVANVLKKVNDCIAGAMLYRSLLLAQDEPIVCHSETVSDVLEGIIYVPPASNPLSPSFPIPCTRDSLHSSDTSDFGMFCKRKFREQGAQRCQEGIKTSSSSTTGGFSLGGIEFGAENAVTSEKGIGINQTCAAAGDKPAQECRNDYNQCLNEANGQGALLVNAPESPAEMIIANIDRELLEFSVDAHILTLPIVDFTMPFRSLKRGSLENKKLYISRLTFLAKWSGFLKRHSIPTTKKKEIHVALAQAQKKFSNSVKRYSKIILAYTIVNPATGQPISEAARDALKQYRKEGGIEKVSENAEKALRTDIESILGVSLSDKFFNEVWLSMSIFGHSRPMEDNDMVVGN